MNRREQIGRPRQILQCQVEEQRLARAATTRALADHVIVGGAVLDGVIKNRRIGGQSGHRKLVDVAFQRPAAQQVAGDIVEPNALAQIMQRPGCLHRITSKLAQRHTHLGTRIGIGRIMCIPAFHNVVGTAPPPRTPVRPQNHTCARNPNTAAL
jgi:hypothetical protein